jgi:hypothetical protein
LHQGAPTKPSDVAHITDTFCTGAVQPLLIRLLSLSALERYYVEEVSTERHAEADAHGAEAVVNVEPRERSHA